VRAKFSSAFRQSLIFALVIGSAELLATTPASAAAPNPTTTTLASDPTSGAMGTVFTLTATVTVGGKPVTAGSVQFTDGRRVLGSLQVIISGPSVGTAVLKTNSFGVGAHSVTASYSGAPNSAQSTAPSKSTPAAITITGPAPTSTGLFVLPSTTQPGTYDLTATLLAASSTIAVGTLSVDELGPSSTVSLGSAPVTTIPGFLPAQTLPETGVGAVGDLNGDGIPDLVLATRNSSNTQAELLVQFGDPNHPGQFLPAVTYPLASIADWTAIGDVNGDGLPDVVVDGIGVFLNDPAHPGQLQPEQLIADPLGFYGAPMLADLNGDGVLDLAGADGTDGVTVYFGDPAHPGQFLAQQSLNLGVANVYSLLVADFNQDGLNDLAVLTVTYDAQGQSTSVVSIFFADPLHTGQFIAGGTYPADGAEYAFLGDFNGDGLPDILSGGTLLLNQAAHLGTFSSIPSNAPPYNIVVADLSGNGISDLISLAGITPCPISPCGYSVPGSATVLLSNPANPGQFTASGTYTFDYRSFPTAVDINGDGQPDLIAAAGDGAIVALGTQTGTVSLLNIVVPGSVVSTLQATYSGDAHYQASSSPFTAIGTSALPTTNQLSASSTNVIVGTSVTFTASIQASLPTPSGSVTFYDGSSVLCTVALDAGGQATCDATLGVGGHSVVAAYLGQGIYASSTSSTVTVVVNVASPQGTLTASPNPIVVVPGTGMGLAGATTIEWNAPTATTIEVHVGSPTGTLFAGGGNTGSATTGAWVTDGMVFCLQNTTGGKPLSDANTLAVLVVHVQQLAIISASPNPIPVPPGALTGVTTIQWNYSPSDLGSPSDSLEVHVGAQDGPLFTSGGTTGSATTGDWVTDGTTFYLQDVNSFGDSYNLGTVVVRLEQQLAVFAANPNPILTSPLGTTTLQWNAPTATRVEIHVGSPTGTLFVAGSSVGSAATGDWVTDGMVFYLQDVSGGKPLTSANTLAKLVLHVGTAYFSASPNPAPSALVDGVAYGSTTFQWNAPTASAVEIRYGSPSGAVVATGGPTAFFQTGLDVTDGAAYYLQDASNPTSSSGTLAMLVMHLQQPSAPFLAANPNPAQQGLNEFGTTTLLWNAPASTAVEIHVGAPDGILFAAGGSNGSATTGPWVTNGELFYLQDVTGGKPLTAANTLAVLIVLFQSN
jgi:hypothetical protein